MSWIVVTNWPKFQHYTDREPVWIKLYTELNSNDDWLGLSTAARGMLATIWIEYARSRGRLTVVKVMQLCGKSARSKHLESLTDAGFVEVSASRPLALARSREKEKEKNPQTPADAGAKVKLSKKELRRYTGCRQTHGSHGLGHIRDPLGTDRPPVDWPHPEPTVAEVTHALAATERKVTP